VIVGNDEKPWIGSTNVKTSKDVRNEARRFFPRLDKSSLDHIMNKLYPERWESHLLYSTQFQRLQQILHDGLVRCNSLALARGNSHSQNGKAYKFTTVHKGHARPFSIYSDETGPSSFRNSTAGDASPKPWMFGLLLTGDPNNLKQGHAVAWEPYRLNKTELVFGPGTNISERRVSEVEEERCLWWQELKSRPQEESSPSGIFGDLGYPGSGAAPPRRNGIVLAVVLGSLASCIVTA